VFAQAVTTIPEHRTATLFVPIQWLCDGQVKELPRDAGYASSCEPKDGRARACRAGTCEDVTVDEEDLKDYDPSDVFGGANNPKNGLCFDTVKCFESSFRVVPNEDCIVELGVPGGYELNLALLNPKAGDGICARGGDPCYIPLDRDASFGWTYAKGSRASSKPLRAQLPVAVCTKLAAGEIQQVQATLECATKTMQFPTCGPWSAVDDSIQIDNDPAPIPSGIDTGDAGPVGPAPTELNIDFKNPGDSIEIGVPVQLQLTAVDEEGVESDATEQATWISEDENIASVEDGVITGHAAGRTRIRAELRGKAAEFDIEVERGAPETIALAVVSKQASPLPLGRSMQFSATAHYPLEHSEEASALGTWKSSDPEVATVDEDGVVVSVGVGTAEITFEMNGTTSEPIEIEVVPAVLESIQVSRSSIAKNQYQLTATGTYSDGSQQDITDEATWEQTAGEEFGTIDENGVLTVITVGVVSVRVSLGNVAKLVNITVTTSDDDAN